MAVWWTNTSSPLLRLMKPYPLSLLNHLTTPTSGISCTSEPESGAASGPYAGPFGTFAKLGPQKWRLRGYEVLAFGEDRPVRRSPPKPRNLETSKPRNLVTFLTGSAPDSRRSSGTQTTHTN